MRIILENSSEISIESAKDLSKFIPSGIEGRSLNYGQGEGQIIIEGKVWGLYLHRGGKNYVLQYEEGNSDWESFQKIVSLLISHIKSSFGSNIKFKVEGCLEHYESHEKYT